jgi:hypothetical protein
MYLPFCFFGKPIPAGKPSPAKLLETTKEKSLSE